jgi:3-dehydro-L-gulonate-6-phosphate decarboxylase
MKWILLKLAPFFVAEGVRAVRDLKALYPHKIVLADAKIADAGKILSRMCFEAMPTG